MLKNYFIIAVRNLLKNKVYSVINILGLSIAIASCMVILWYIMYHVNFDGFHKNRDCIYRVEIDGDMEGTKRVGEINTHYILAPTLEKEFPEIVKTVRIQPGVYSPIFIKKGENTVKEQNYFYADNSLFQVFSLPLSAGNPDHALENPYSVVISKKTARKYFGNNDPLGKELQVNISSEWYYLKVSGVLEDIPDNSFLNADMILTMSVMYDSQGKRFSKRMPPGLANKNPLDGWQMIGNLTYILLPEDYPAIQLESKFSGFINKYLSDNWVKNFRLRPLKDIHLYSYHSFRKTGNAIKNVYLFAALGLLILMVAGINYIILSTAQYKGRLNDIAIRKVVGASNANLRWQILGESVLITLLSLPMAIALLEILLPVVKRLFNVDMGNYHYHAWEFITGSAFIVILIGIVSGSYLAFNYSRRVPVEIFRRESHGNKSGTVLRRLLVLLQISIFVGLISCTLIIYRQMNHVRTMQLGYDQEHLIKIDVSDMKYRERYGLLKNELKRNPDIANVSGSSSLPLPISSRMSWSGRLKNNPQKQVTYQYVFVDYGYFETLKMQVVEGRSFSEEMASDGHAVVMNENAVREFELEDPVGEEIIFMEKQERKVIGVVSNTIQTVYRESEPCIFVLNPLGVFNIVVRLRPGNIREALKGINKTWSTVFPDIPFDFKFFDQEIQSYYEKDRRLGRLIGCFTFLAILIACMGLFGLSLFVTGERAREICIRKVLGATVPDILSLFFKEYLVLTFAAVIVACPVSYYIINRWLQNFAYRINIGISLFILSGLLALCIVAASIIFQVVKASLANPVEALRYE